MSQQDEQVDRSQHLGILPLPVQLTSFIGRERELAEVKRLLASSRLVTLTGAGGCGKTRLALRVASDLLAQYADGVRWVELAPLADATLLPQAIAKALNAAEQPGRALLDVILDLLRDKHLLLVLDNCEHLIHACAQLAETLLTHCPAVKILATSREPLNIAGETTFRVPSLALPNLQSLPPLESFAQFEAVRLFTERAQAAQSAFQLTDANKPAIAQICTRLDGMPLALELAAARVKTMAAEEIAARLDDRFRLLTTGSRTAPTRQQTLRAAMDWSYALLSAQEQTVLDRLSVFAGGWTLEAAEAICADVPDVLDWLSHLVDKSLVIVEMRNGATRYRMLETIRQYAREKLIEAGKHESAQNRHLEYFMKLAEEAEPKLIGAEQMTWYIHLDSELDNLRTALDWSASEDRVEKGLRLGGALYRFWLTRGYWVEAYHRMDDLLKTDGADKRTLGRGKALKVAGSFANMTGAAEISRRLFEESISIFRELGAKGRPWLESALGHYAHSLLLHDHTTARICAEETARLSRESGNIPDLAQAFLVLGNVAQWKCDFSTALRCFEETKLLYQSIGDQRGMSASITTFTEIYFLQGNLEKAEEVGEQVITMAREMGNKYHLAGGLARLGAIYQVCDQNDKAETLLHQGISALKEVGNKASLALAQMHLGHLHLRRGQYAQAHQDLRESLIFFKESSALYYFPYALESFAYLLSVSSNAQRAAQLLGATQALREKFDTPLAPVYREEYESYLATARTQLDDATFNVAWNAGRVMTLDQAIAFALAEIKIPDTQDAPALSPRQIAKEKFGGLTTREREIAALIAQGKSNREIANTLVLSERTIEGHVSNILNKLGFNARSQIAAWAVQKGLEKN